MNHMHDMHEGHSPEIFKRKFWLSLVLTAPVLMYSGTLQQLLGFRSPSFFGSEFIPAIFSTILFFYAGLVFIKAAKVELINRKPGMMTLISLAIIVAYSYSVVSLFLHGHEDFFWELSTLITIMILGHWIEMRSVNSAHHALHELAKLLPDMAELVKGDKFVQVAVSELKVGDVVIVRPGAQIPVDGEVTRGESSVNEAMITGESKLLAKSQGSEVIGGTTNGNGSLYIKAKKVGDQTALSGIMRLVDEAQKSKSTSQILADRAAFYLTIIAVSSAFITLTVWILIDGNLDFAFARMVTVLVIACPHALGLAIPLVVSISTTIAATHGLLVRKRSALELARNIDIVLFDKTGTLTLGEQGVVDVWGENRDAVISIAAAVESESEHPIGRALVSTAKKHSIKIPNVTNFSAMPGRGVRGSVGGKKIMVGGPKLLQELKIIPDSEIKLFAKNRTLVYVIVEDQIFGAIALADIIRKESKETIEKLKQKGIKVAMVTGDSNEVAAEVAKELGIDNYFAGILPELKAGKVKDLQDNGAKVAFVGDGVNDAPALIQANVGIAIGAGTNVAIESAGIILLSNDPRGVVKVFALSKASYRKMQQNLFWATGYNVLAIPLAAGALSMFGFVLVPALGAILMSLSTIIVVINAQFLKNTKL